MLHQNLRGLIVIGYLSIVALLTKIAEMKTQFKSLHVWKIIKVKFLINAEKQNRRVKHKTKKCRKFQKGRKKISTRESYSSKICPLSQISQ